MEQLDQHRLWPFRKLTHDLELDSLAFKLNGSDFKVNLWYVSIMSRPHTYQDQ